LHDDREDEDDERAIQKAQECLSVHTCAPIMKIELPVAAGTIVALAMPVVVIVVMVPVVVTVVAIPIVLIVIIVGVGGRRHRGNA
jgi:hypothetical protein